MLSDFQVITQTLPQTHQRSQDRAMSHVEVYITYIIYLISGLSVSPQRCDNPILATLASTCHKGFVFGRLVCTLLSILMVEIKCLTKKSVWDFQICFHDLFQLAVGGLVVFPWNVSKYWDNDSFYVINFNIQLSRNQPAMGITTSWQKTTWLLPSLQRTN